MEDKVTNQMLETDDPYPSRMFETPRILPRREPVVHGPRGAGLLSAAEIAFFEANGYLVFEEMFERDEVARYVDELRALSRRPDVREARETVLEPDSHEVRSIFNIHRTNPVFRTLAHDPRLVRRIVEFLGGPIYLHQSRINYKPGFRGKGFDWHSDFETWHVEDGMPGMRAISCSIALTENTPYNGPLMLIPGSHLSFVACIGATPADHYKQSLRKQEYGVPDDDSVCHLVDKGGIVAPTGPPGSVTLFDCNVMHGSNSNITPWPRSNVFFVYNSVDNALGDPRGGIPPRPDFIASRDFTPVPFECADGPQPR